MANFVLGFLISFITSLLVVRYAHLHEKYSADWDTSGVQKFHVRPVPRIGGLGMYIGFTVVGAVAFLRGIDVGLPCLTLALCAAPAFMAGVIEDLTKKISPRTRLIATMVSAALAIWLLDAVIVRADLPVIDTVLGFAPIAMVLTAVAVAGLANAVNIIDGFNGLASMVSAMMFLSLAYVAFQVGDTFVLTAAFAMTGVILGFFLWNFPAGMIFLGDGGAYFCGFLLAELAILLVMRHPQISAWYPVLMVIYPIFETLFSIYRRRFVRGVPVGYPDGVHLHTLIYQRLMRWAVGSKEERHRLRRNSFTAPYLWMISLLAVLPATLFWNRTIVLIVCTVIFVVAYVWLYWSIVRFKSPRWMIVKKKNH